MGRDDAIKLSKQEKKLLREVRKRWFGTDEVPFGYVVERLATEKLAKFDVAEQYEGGNYARKRHEKFHEPDDVIDKSENTGVNE